jgi:hypothetical protein
MRLRRGFLKSLIQGLALGISVLSGCAEPHMTVETPGDGSDNEHLLYLAESANLRRLSEEDLPLALKRHPSFKQSGYVEDVGADRVASVNLHYYLRKSAGGAREYQFFITTESDALLFAEWSDERRTYQSGRLYSDGVIRIDLKKEKLMYRIDANGRFQRGGIE